MTKSELIARLSTSAGPLSQSDIELSVQTILKAITDNLASGGRVEIRGFGSFHLNTRAPRVGRNPKTGEQVQVPEKRVPYFKPGNNLKDRVNMPQKWQIDNEEANPLWKGKRVRQARSRALVRNGERTAESMGIVPRELIKKMTIKHRA